MDIDVDFIEYMPKSDNELRKILMPYVQYHSGLISLTGQY